MPGQRYVEEISFHQIQIRLKTSSLKPRKRRHQISKKEVSTAPQYPPKIKKKVTPTLSLVYGHCVSIQGIIEVFRPPSVLFGKAAVWTSVLDHLHFNKHILVEKFTVTLN